MPSTAVIFRARSAESPTGLGRIKKQIIYTEVGDQSRPRASAESRSEEIGEARGGRQERATGLTFREGPTAGLTGHPSLQRGVPQVGGVSSQDCYGQSRGLTSRRANVPLSVRYRQSYGHLETRDPNFAWRVLRERPRTFDSISEETVASQVDFNNQLQPEVLVGDHRLRIAPYPDECLSLSEPSLVFPKLTSLPGASAAP